jgi:SAM-dependent methyltransferase
MRNVDEGTVEGFGDEWSRFDQAAVTVDEQRSGFERYFRIFPWGQIGSESIGFDAGCGSGRWAALASEQVKTLHCVDASERALAVARRRLADRPNVVFHHASVADLPFDDDSMDFGYSLGVLHHVPDTAAGIAACARKLKPGAPLLVYLYYAFDNRPPWFRTVWKASDVGRRIISRMPHPLRYATSQVIAASVYWPLARSARLLESFGVPVDNLPLSAYRDTSFYGMRTDALDRFGTRLEQRFTRGEIEKMMTAAGLEHVRFNDDVPFWCAVGYKRAVRST